MDIEPQQHIQMYIIQYQKWIYTQPRICFHSLFHLAIFSMPLRLRSISLDEFGCVYGWQGLIGSNSWIWFWDLPLTVFRLDIFISSMHYLESWSTGKSDLRAKKSTSTMKGVEVQKCVRIPPPIRHSSCNVKARWSTSHDCLMTETVDGADRRRYLLTTRCDWVNTVSNAHANNVNLSKYRTTGSSASCYKDVKTWARVLLVLLQVDRLIFR